MLNQRGRTTDLGFDKLPLRLRGHYFHYAATKDRYAFCEGLAEEVKPYGVSRLRALSRVNRIGISRSSRQSRMAAERKTRNRRRSRAVG